MERNTFLDKLLRALQGRAHQAGDTVRAYHPKIAALTPEAHPREAFSEKRAGRHGGFKEWEKKLWAPKLDKDGNLWRPEQKFTRQQRRRRIFKEALAYMKEQYPGEPRANRRRLGFARARNFFKTEQKLARVEQSNNDTPKPV